ncbi:hypothetical protein C1T17_16365 [Sphingobium sp. SCG-1]|nr:hypothetical protein C1T17_16365 [Sphingobium sp. SCG-1]
MGINLDHVFAVFVTHWDDDHCKGLAKVVKACTSANLVMSTAFTKRDFISFTQAYASPMSQNVRAGVKEINEVLKELADTKRPVYSAYPGRRLFTASDVGLSPGQRMEIWSLSPSDEEYQNFIAWVATQMPQADTTRRVAMKRLRNDLSVVLHISLGEDVILLGGDLEEEGKATTGWSAVLNLRGGPTALADVFKVPHHGSITGHHDDVAAQLLSSDPLALVAPFKNGKVSLPTKADVTRISGYAANSHSTANLSNHASPRRDAVVDKTIREVTKRFSTIKPDVGMVRLRKVRGSGSAWNVEHFGSASPLSDIHQ